MVKRASQTLQATGRVFRMMTMDPILEVYPDVAGLQSGSGRVRFCPSRPLPRSGQLVGRDATDHHAILGPENQYNLGI